MDNKLNKLMFYITMVLQAICFLGVCVSIGFVDLLFLPNAIFIIIYIISLWTTSVDSYDIFSREYFVVDLCTIAIYANFPKLFCDGYKNSLTLFWTLFALIEAICMVWNTVSSKKACKDEAIAFFTKWNILTVLGIIVCAIFIMCLELGWLHPNGYGAICLNIILILYEITLLIIWHIDRKEIFKKGTSI